MLKFSFLFLKTALGEIYSLFNCCSLSGSVCIEDKVVIDGTDDMAVHHSLQGSPGHCVGDTILCHSCVTEASFARSSRRPKLVKNRPLKKTQFPPLPLEMNGRPDGNQKIGFPYVCLILLCTE